MTNSAQLWLVVNSASGSNDDAALAALVERLGSVGHAPTRLIDCSKEDLPNRADLEQAAVTMLAVFTGDGTLGALLPPLEGWAGQVLVLPGGTTNLLAKLLHDPCETAAIVSAFAAGQVRVIHPPCVRSSSQLSLCEVLAGPGAKWSDVREGLREGDLTEVANTALEAVKASAGGAMVRVAEPPLGNSDGYAGVRIVPSAQGLVIDGYRADGFADYLKQGLALLQRDFREGPHDELGPHREVVCRSADGSPIELMIDGERATGSAEVRFSLATLVLNLLATGHA